MDENQISSITWFSMACGVAGKCYYVSLPQTKMKEVFNYAASLSEKEKLVLIEAPDMSIVGGYGE